MVELFSSRTLKAFHGSTNGPPCRLFSRLHPLHKKLVEVISVFSAPPGDKQGLAKTDGGTTAGARTQWVVGQTNRDDGNLHSLPQSHLGQTSQSRLQNDWFVVAIDPSLRKDNKLLIIGQQIQRVTERCERGFVLIYSKTPKAMEKPALDASHFSARHHESTVAS